MRGRRRSLLNNIVTSQRQKIFGNFNVKVSGINSFEKKQFEVEFSVFNGYAVYTPDRYTGDYFQVASAMRAEGVREEVFTLLDRVAEDISSKKPKARTLEEDELAILRAIGNSKRTIPEIAQKVDECLGTVTKSVFGYLSQAKLVDHDIDDDRMVIVELTEDGKKMISGRENTGSGIRERLSNLWSVVTGRADDGHR